MAHNVDARGNLITLAYNDLGMAVSAGRIAGVKSLNKFGRSTNVDSSEDTDIWDRANATHDQAIWVAPTAARQHSIVSASDADSDTGGVKAQGAGARTLRIYGLTSWTSKEVSEDVVMDGTQAFNTSNSYVIIHRMKVLTKGATVGANVGLITATAASDGTITAQINAGQGQTQMAIYGVPSVQKLYLVSFYAVSNRAAGPSGLVDITLKVNPEPDVERTGFLTKHTTSISSGTLPSIFHTFVVPKTISGPCIIKIQGNASANDFDVSAGFDGMLIDN